MAAGSTRRGALTSRQPAMRDAGPDGRPAMTGPAYACPHAGAAAMLV
jgi:hypothetical protein